MRRGTIAVLLVLAIGATIFAQKSGGDRSGGGDSQAETQLTASEPPRSGTTEVTNLCFTGISVSSNNVALSLAWPTNHLFAGDIVDLFAATSLVGAAWNWVAAHGVASNTETNWTEIVDTAAVAGTPNPPMMFFSASLRADPGDLRDTDGDTIPDAYEIHNGTNPYVSDYALAPKLTVGPSGEHADISSALAASEAYDIVELDPTAVHDVGGIGASVPAHPVIVCSPPGQCAVVRATGTSAFLLDSASSSRTLFRNLYILLDARSNFQVGFWVGGSLPLNPMAASAIFEDIYVRAPNPGVEYFGWLLYNSAVDAVTLSRCTVNAAGSEWMYGVTDEQERFVDHTDPHDGGNFRLSGTKILYTDLDYGQGVTNLIEVSPFQGGWDPNNVATSFVSRTFTYDVDTIVTGGVVYVKCLRDLDGDGELNVGVEQIVVTRLTLASRGKSENATVGDYDDDGIADTQELHDGTDPHDKNNYAINLFGCFTGVFHTTNVLSATFRTSSEMLYGPILLTNGTSWTFVSNRIEVTGGGRPYFVFWDDADSNEVHEASEASVTYLPSPFSHDMAFTNRLSYGSFDKDYDGMLDWWELQHGLSPTNTLDSFGDNDCDGLLNIYEFMHGYNPLLIDATNTALAAFASSVDNRLLGKIPQEVLYKFIDYPVNGSNLVFCANDQFWAMDIDTSCASMWNTPPQGTHAYGWHYAGTAISLRHVLFAHHFAPNNGTTLWFMGNDGNLYSGVLSNTIAAGPDIRVGVLTDNLSTNITPAKILPENYTAYIGSGQFLPSVTFDQEEKLLVSDIISLQDIAHRNDLSSSGPPGMPIRAQFYENVVGGDSGNPRFLVWGNQVILLYTMWKGGGGSGCFITHYRQEIQNAMNHLCPGYVLQEVDLSGFDQLSPMENGGCHE